VIKIKGQSKDYLIENVEDYGEYSGFVQDFVSDSEVFVVSMDMVVVRFARGLAGSSFFVIKHDYYWLRKCGIIISCSIG